MSIIGFPAKVIFDTSIYIPLINKGITHPLLNQPYTRPVIYMSAVVMEELYAGAFDQKSIKLLNKLYDTFKNLNRLMVPDGSEWQTAGKIVAKLGQKHGFESKYLSKIQNDILIALSARRIGAIVITNNMQDFFRIKEFVDFEFVDNLQ